MSSAMQIPSSFITLVVAVPMTFAALMLAFSRWRGLRNVRLQKILLVIAALTNLGYSPGDAARAAAALPAAPDLSLEDRVKMALRHLST